MARRRRRTNRLLLIWIRRAYEAEVLGFLYYLNVSNINLSCRSMIGPLFTHEHVNAMRLHIQQIVDSLIDELAREGGGQPANLVKFALSVASCVRWHNL